MTNQSSIKYISGLLDSPATLSEGDQSSIALFRQTFPYFVPMRYLSALESHKREAFAPAMMSQILPYMGNWMLFCDFLQQGTQENAEGQTPTKEIEGPIKEKEAAQPIPQEKNRRFIKEPAGKTKPEPIVPPLGVTPYIIVEPVKEVTVNDLPEVISPTPDIVLQSAFQTEKKETPTPSETVLAQKIEEKTPVFVPEKIPARALEIIPVQVPEILPIPEVVSPSPLERAGERSKGGNASAIEIPAPVAAIIPDKKEDTVIPFYRPEPIAEPVKEITAPPPTEKAASPFFFPSKVIIREEEKIPERLSGMTPFRAGVDVVGPEPVPEPVKEITALPPTEKIAERISGTAPFRAGVDVVGPEPIPEPVKEITALPPTEKIAERISGTAPFRAGVGPGYSAPVEPVAETIPAAAEETEEVKDDTEPGLLIYPVYSEDYFLHQGVPVSPVLAGNMKELTQNEQEDKSLMVMMSFSEWLLHFKNTSEKQKEEKKDQKSLKTMWQKEKLAAAMEEENEEIPENVFEMAVNSIAKEDGLASETLAEIYIKQKKYDKAIEMFRKLSLRNPKKNTYFARKIEEVLKEKQS